MCRLGLTWLGDGQFSPLFAVVDVAGTDQPDDLN